MEKKKKNKEATLPLAQVGGESVGAEAVLGQAVVAESGEGSVKGRMSASEGMLGEKIPSQEPIYHESQEERGASQERDKEGKLVGKEAVKKGTFRKQSSVAVMDSWIRSLMKFLLELWDYMICTVPDWKEKVPVPQGIPEGQYDPLFFTGLMELLKRKSPAGGSQGLLQEQSLQEKMEQWRMQEASAKELYPALDLREELKDPRFVELLDCGIDVRTAFEIIHKDQILCASMHFAASEMERRLREKQPKARPTENGGNQGPALCKHDVSRMSRRERKELIRRAQMGEIIRL